MNAFKQCAILDFKDLRSNGTTDLPVGGHTFHIQFPFIVNRTLINKGDEVVLKWEKIEDQPVAAQKTTQTAFDQIAVRESMRQKKGP